MSKTVQEIQAWLLNPDAIKVLLVDISGVNPTTDLNTTTTVYLSSRAYISETSVNYNPCIIGGISYTESLNFDGNASLSYGDIELDNTDGTNDIYLTYYWNNRPVNIYIGDARWPKGDFSLVFTGIVSGVASRARGTINLTLLDTMARLNTAISETILESTPGSGYIASNNIVTNYAGSNQIVEGSKKALRPITFGECFNVSPLLVGEGYYYSGSTYGQLYQYHNGLSEDIIEVRDNGAPVSILKVASSGCFALTDSSYGTITASVQGGYIGSYSPRVHNVIRNILTNYGGAYKLAHSDLDFNFQYVGSNLPNVGYYCSDRENVLDVCNKLATTSGYQLVNNTVTAYVGSSTHQASAGKVKLVRMDLRNVTTTYTITDDDMVLNSLQIKDALPVKSSIRLNYCKNWTVEETNLAEALAPSSVSYFKDAWIPNRYTSSNYQALYKDSTEPPEEETYIVAEEDVINELDRRANLFGTPRYIVTATYLPHMIFAQLGDGVEFSLYSTKFNSILNGKKGIVYEIQRNWLSNTISIGVLI